MQKLYPSHLFKHQIECVEWMTRNHGGTKHSSRRDALKLQKGGVIADEMGLGKTLSALSGAIVQYELDVRCKYESVRVYADHGILIVAPKSLVDQWKHQVDALQFAGCIKVTSYEQLPLQKVWSMIILDEAHVIRNQNTQLYKKICALQSMRKYAVTGTPINNSVDDLRTLYEWIGCEAYLKRTREEAGIKLPPLVRRTVYVELSEEERRLHDECSNSTERRVIATNATLKEGSSSTKTNCIVRWLRCMQDAEPHSYFIVFSQWTKVLKKLDSQVGGYVYEGELSSEERTAIQKEYTTHPRKKVLYATLQSGGTGLNLVCHAVGCKQYIVFADLWYNPFVHEQALCRAYRIGQMYPVHVITFCCKGSEEEKVLKIQQAKLALDEKQNTRNETCEQESSGSRVCSPKQKK